MYLRASIWCVCMRACLCGVFMFCVVYLCFLFMFYVVYSCFMWCIYVLCGVFMFYIHVLCGVLMSVCALSLPVPSGEAMDGPVSQCLHSGGERPETGLLPDLPH